jgi:hypothetical protein
MPAAYEKMRDKFIREGMSPEAAKKKAARIYNSTHKESLFDYIKKHEKRKK